MKAILAIVGGFVLTLAVFVSGLAVATWLLAAKPVQQTGLSHDVTDLWTREPRTVKTPVEGLERVPARPAEPDVNPPRKAPVAEAAPGNAELLDTTITGSVEPGSEAVPAAPAWLSQAHLDWCSSRYRSYRPADNSYAPYSGGRRKCVSPYLESAERRPEAAVTSDSLEFADTTAEAVEEGGLTQLTAEHVEDCFGRYRSYRPEDNTYQPYGGGPRRQCQ